MCLAPHVHPRRRRQAFRALSHAQLLPPALPGGSGGRRARRAPVLRRPDVAHAPGSAVHRPVVPPRPLRRPPRRAHHLRQRRAAHRGYLQLPYAGGRGVRRLETARRVDAAYQLPRGAPRTWTSSSTPGSGCPCRRKTTATSAPATWCPPIPTPATGSLRPGSSPWYLCCLLNSLQLMIERRPWLQPGFQNICAGGFRFLMDFHGFRHFTLGPELKTRALAAMTNFDSYFL